MDTDNVDMDTDDLKRARSGAAVYAKVTTAERLGEVRVRGRRADGPALLQFRWSPDLLQPAGAVVKVMRAGRRRGPSTTAGAREQPSPTHCGPPPLTLPGQVRIHFPAISR